MVNQLPTVGKIFLKQKILKLRSRYYNSLRVLCIQFLVWGNSLQDTITFPSVFQKFSLQDKKRHTSTTAHKHHSSQASQLTRGRSAFLLWAIWSHQLHLFPSRSVVGKNESWACIQSKDKEVRNYITEKHSFIDQ